MLPWALELWRLRLRLRCPRGHGLLSCCHNCCRKTCVGFGIIVACPGAQTRVQTQPWRNGSEDVIIMREIAACRPSCARCRFAKRCGRCPTPEGERQRLACCIIYVASSVVFMLCSCHFLICSSFLFLHYFLFEIILVDFSSPPPLLVVCCLLPSLSSNPLIIFFFSSLLLLYIYIYI